MVHVKSPLLSLKLDLEHENVDILKNGFYHRIEQPSEHPIRERAKNLVVYSSRNVVPRTISYSVLIITFCITSELTSQMQRNEDERFIQTWTVLI